MSHFAPNDMTRGEFFSSASFDFSPSASDPMQIPSFGPFFMSEEGLLPGQIDDLAVQALLSEVYATPKPGLVDLENNGSHIDMDYRSFVVSASALRHCFGQCAQAGMTFPENLPVLAATLRRIGLAGEKAMYAATAGVNTHKGAIFSMGILCAAAAMGPFADMAELQTRCQKIADTLLADEPLNIKQAEHSEHTQSDHTQSGCARRSHGLAVRQNTGIGGIRKEALSGFNTAFSVGLPALQEALAAGRSRNDAMVYALLRIMASTGDSNLVHRGGVEGMDFAQKEAHRLVEAGPAGLDLDEVRQLDVEFIKRNLSPGGSADLLAFSAMLYRIKKGNHND